MQVDSLVAFSTALASIVEEAAASVVAVHGRPRFHSSGVHWSPRVVVTANHALHREDEVELTHDSGDRLTATIVGRDTGTDLAVLRLQGDPPARIGVAQPSVAALRPGNLALAVGRNHESANAGFGIVSSLGGPSETRFGGKLDRVIRLDLSLHPAAVGGAVCDAEGKLIGIATPALSRASVFAVPKETVDRVVRALLERGRTGHGYLGAALQPIAVPEHLTNGQATGLIALSVEAGSPAGQAGLVIGDILLAWNGEALSRPERLSAMLADSVGKASELRILRGGEMRTLEVRPVERKRSR